MEWSQKSATDAYLDAIKLCGKCRADQCNSREGKMPEGNEFISALAAGMCAKLIVEVTSEVSPLTVALAAAARHTGGKLVCILPEPKLPESREAIKDSGLIDMVEFRTGDPAEALLNYENIDFSLVDCQADDYGELLEKLDVNPRMSVVVANNLLQGERGLEGRLKRSAVGAKTDRVRSRKHPIGKGSMEIAMIGKSNNDLGKREKRDPIKRRGMATKRDKTKSKWVFQVDDKSGEEHIFRMPELLH